MRQADDETGINGDLRPPMRADARRNLDALLKAAMAVFTESGVDVPMRTIASQAGVGVGTLYRHFPQRSDLIKAIIRREVELLVVMAESDGGEHGASEALTDWMNRLVDFVATKRGLGPALHSGDPAYQALPDFVFSQLTPALQKLLDAAAASGTIRGDVHASDLLNAALRVATPASEGDVAQAKRMIALLVDGLHNRSSVSADRR